MQLFNIFLMLLGGAFLAVMLVVNLFFVYHYQLFSNDYDKKQIK